MKALKKSSERDVQILTQELKLSTICPVIILSFFHLLGKVKLIRLALVLFHI
jgi:hypothetical protein